MLAPTIEPIRSMDLAAGAVGAVGYVAPEAFQLNPRRAGPRCPSHCGRCGRAVPSLDPEGSCRCPSIASIGASASIGHQSPPNPTPDALKFLRSSCLISLTGSAPGSWAPLGTSPAGHSNR